MNFILKTVRSCSPAKGTEDGEMVSPHELSVIVPEFLCSTNLRGEDGVENNG